MQPFPPTIIWRHHKENLKKCSLRGLEIRPDFNFFSYPNNALPDLTNYILLDINGAPLDEGDSHRGLLILDGTWRYANKMLERVNQLPGSYQPLVENSHFDRAKAPGLNDRKSPQISNIGRLTIVQPRELSRGRNGDFQLEPGIVRRRIPEHFRTAYPRRQDDCADPERGLSSIEAIYISYHILGRDTSHLLDNYHWKDLFLQKNGLGSRIGDLR